MSPTDAEKSAHIKGTTGDSWSAIDIADMSPHPKRKKFSLLNIDLGLLVPVILLRILYAKECFNFV